MILLEPRLLELRYNILDVFRRGSNKVDSLEMRQFLCGLFGFLDQVDIVLVELWLCVDDGDHGGGLLVQEEGFHAGNLAEDAVEVVLGDVQDVCLTLFNHCLMGWDKVTFIYLSYGLYL